MIKSAVFFLFLLLGWKYDIAFFRYLLLVLYYVGLVIYSFMSVICLRYALDREFARIYFAVRFLHGKYFLPAIICMAAVAFAASNLGANHIVLLQSIEIFILIVMYWSTKDIYSRYHGNV